MRPSPATRLPARRIRAPLQTDDYWPVLASVLLQLALGFFLGNLYDMRVNLAAGYAVGTGGNPYVPVDLSAVFHNELFRNFSTIGYPPPWPLVLGLIYKCSYSVYPNILLYSMAVKIPIIAANICLAYLVARVLSDCHAGAHAAHEARRFMLLNPAVLLFSCAWGQIDSIAALFSLLSIMRLNSGKWRQSAILLALAIALKPIVAPVAIAILVYITIKSVREAFRYCVFVFGAGLVFCTLPFVIFRWDPSIVLKNWDAHVTFAGCMSFLSISEIWNPSMRLTGPWLSLGMLWAPAMTFAAVYFLYRKVTGFDNLLTMCAIMTLIFFLTKTWLSEPNILILMPYMLMLTLTGRIDRKSLALFWAMPLMFSFFNGSLAALLFPCATGAMNAIIAFGNEYRGTRLILRSLITIPWFLMGARVVFRGIANKGDTPGYLGEVNWK
jgi:hypothetical protein